MIPDALDNPPRTKAQAAADMRERARMLRARAVLFRAEADQLDRMAAELENAR